MDNKIVAITGRNHAEDPPPVTDFWFAQLDVRLGKIEFMVARLEWQIWLIVCGAVGVLVLEIIQALAAN